MDLPRHLPATNADAFRANLRPYTFQVDAHERILADLQAKLEPAENAVNALQERFAEIEGRLLESQPRKGT